MIIAIPKETISNETRVSCTPISIKDLIKSGFEVHVESGAGLDSFISNKDYENVGAKIISNTKELLGNCDIILKVAPPTIKER